MNAKALLIVFLVVFSAACKKNSTGKLSNLTLTGLSARSVNVNGNLSFYFNFSHPYSGDVSDTLGVRINYKTCTYKSIDTTYMYLPTFSNTANQTCKLEFIYRFGQEGSFTTGCSDNVNVFKSDSAWFQFWLIDRNSVSSDTISSPMVFLNQ